MLAAVPPTTPMARRPRQPARAAALPPDERRQAIVDAVIPLLVEQGAGVTTRQMAEAADVAEGTLFRVFDDKAAVLHAAAHSLLDPERSRRAMSKVDPGLRLDAMVLTVTEQLLASMGQIMAVLMAVRGAHVGPDGGRPTRSGPPEFILESHRASLQNLTELFGRYRDELRVPPTRAALLLRTLVFGARQPWTDQAQSLTAQEIATVLLKGIATDSRPEGN